MLIMNMVDSDKDNNKVLVQLKIRRYDHSDEPQTTTKFIHFDPNMEYNDLKKEIQNICDVGPEDNKVIKLRKSDEILIPLLFLLETKDSEDYFFLDVCKINYPNKANTSLLQDAYIDSVCQKLRNMESRIEKAEYLLPQLEWRRQNHMESTVNGLSSKVSFLNRRINDLIPPEWRSKMPQTMA